MGMECPYIAIAETDEEVLNDIKGHGMEVHAEAMEAMSDEEKAGMEVKMKEVMYEEE